MSISGTLKRSTAKGRPNGKGRPGTKRSPSPKGRSPTAGGDRRVILALLACETAALAGQVTAVCMARVARTGPEEVVSDLSLILAYAAPLWVLTRRYLTRTMRNTAVLCLGLGSTLLYRSTNPLIFTGFDEQLHMRTLGDIISSHRLFEANPLLEVSPRYPGLESITLVIHQLGVPTMLSATITVLLARTVLVTVMCDAVEQITGSARAGGLAVAVYATSPQFVFFNSQFSYQTLSIPIALAAMSMIARARTAKAPLPYFGGATICLLTVSMTHHVTTFICAGLLLIWTFLEKGQARGRVAFGFLVAVAATLAWAIVQRSLLTDYFGPIINDVVSQFGGGERRKAFGDSAGTKTPLLDQIALLYYAAALSGVVAWLGLKALGFWRRGERHVIGFTTHFLLLAFAGCLPVFLAARVVPKGGELFDRGSSFLFIPFGLILASYLTRLYWQDDPPGLRWPQPPPRLKPFTRRNSIIRGMLVGAASIAFVGGYVLGGGPNWARLPGPYMAAADPRSMDAEVLAAVKWAGGALPAGSRLGADRVFSDLAASRAGLWPLMKGDSWIDVPALYVAHKWDQQETDWAASMKVRYLFVDRRLALEKPHFGSYFYNGETGMNQQLTAEQLNKFDHIRGIKEIYRHGPISIYDLKALGIPELRSGWFKATPIVALSTQLAVGLSCGLFIALLMRSRAWPWIAKNARELREAWGPALTGAVLMASGSLTMIALLLERVWVTPVTMWTAILTVVVTNLSATVALVRRATSRVSWQGVRTVSLIAIPFVIIAGVAILDAATVNIFGVEKALNDPTAIHIPFNGPKVGGPT